MRKNKRNGPLLFLYALILIIMLAHLKKWFTEGVPVYEPGFEVINHCPVYHLTVGLFTNDVIIQEAQP